VSVNVHGAAEVPKDQLGSCVGSKSSRAKVLYFSQNLKFFKQKPFHVANPINNQKASGSKSCTSCWAIVSWRSFKIWMTEGISEATSCKSGRHSAYNEDLRWQMIYQRQIIHVMVLIQAIY